MYTTLHFRKPYFNPTFMKIVCPECKNDVNLTPYPNLKKDDVIECDQCGITLMVMETAEGQWVAEVVDEGK